MTTGAVAARARSLLVLRHAKAASAPAGLADFERPLAARGEQEAAAAGAWLRAAAIVPDLVVCSTAWRTRQTWDAVVAELPSRPEVRYDDRVYRNTLEDLLEIVRETDDAVRSLLLVSHNPAAQQLAAALTVDAEPYEGFPTCALALIEFTEPWAAAADGAGRLVRFWSPRLPPRS